MKCLEYPFDGEYLIKKKKSIRRELLAETKSRVPAKIAILGGSTTNDMKLMLELFLLNYGIEPSFYESEYDQFYQDAMFPNAELEAFAPEIIYIHTSVRNIKYWPVMADSDEEVKTKLLQEKERFSGMWQHLAEVYHCPVIQNNFEYPYYRILGNKDASDFHGHVNFVTKLNSFFADYAMEHENFYIHDLNYVSACYGLDKWSDPFYWHMYKYCCSVTAIPDLAFSVARIIKSIYGKNKKAYVLDMDNTLWGGVIGDDGVENIMIGQENSVGQVYAEFQQYIKEQKQIGVILNIDSKNDYDNAVSGLKRPDSVLLPEDFISIKANWEPKDRNLQEIAAELSLLPESFVFVDDNPAERAIVEGNVPGVAVPEIDRVENYIRILDRSGFFEATSLSGDDLKRNEMYQKNAKREAMKASFTDYAEYLRSLEMKADVKPFEGMYMARITQLTNKSNQFNLTTKRYTQTEIEEIANNSSYLTLYGRLEDKFGDNGVVSVVIGRMEKEELFIDLWLMSCRVLKRDMECAMMDTLVKRAKAQGIKKIYGFYYKTAKNSMVKDFYKDRTFKKQSEDADGNSVWELLTEPYKEQNTVIDVED